MTTTTPPPAGAAEDPSEKVAAPAEESSAAASPGDNLSLWSEKWEADQTGWHERDINHILKKHGGLIVPGGFAGGNGDTDTGSTCMADTADRGDGKDMAPVHVFVPLCGKTVDMVHLAHHAGVSWVYGVDGISKAVEEFAEENPSLVLKQVAKAKITDTNTIEAWIGEKITLRVKDFFQLEKGSFAERADAVWDRASLVAIAPAKRSEYVTVIGKLIKPGGKILLATVDKREGNEEARKAGPPYSVDESAVRALYEDAAWVESVELVAEYDGLVQNPSEMERWKGKGIESMFELVFLIKGKQE